MYSVTHAKGNQFGNSVEIRPDPSCEVIANPNTAKEIAMVVEEMQRRNFRVQY
jgi:hypothetical protein